MKERIRRKKYIERWRSDMWFTSKITPSQCLNLYFQQRAKSQKVTRTLVQITLPLHDIYVPLTGKFVNERARTSRIKTDCTHVVFVTKSSWLHKCINMSTHGFENTVWHVYGTYMHFDTCAKWWTSDRALFFNNSCCYWSTEQGKTSYQPSEFKLLSY